MKLNIFHSIPEALTYFLLILMLILNIIGLFISAENAQQARTIAAQDKSNTMKVLQSQECIAAYFNTQGRNGNTTLNEICK